MTFYNISGSLLADIYNTLDLVYNRMVPDVTYLVRPELANDNNPDQWYWNQ